VLSNLHLDGLFLSICAKLGVTLNKRVQDIDFNADEFLTPEDITLIKPMAKDYQDLSLCLLSNEDGQPFGLQYMLAMARDKDLQGQRSTWNIPGGPERERASAIY
jgi:hypothetical protein